MAVCFFKLVEMNHNLFSALQHSATAVFTQIFSIPVDVITDTSIQEVR